MLKIFFYDDFILRLELFESGGGIVVEVAVWAGLGCSWGTQDGVGLGRCSLAVCTCCYCSYPVVVGNKH